MSMALIRKVGYIMKFKICCITDNPEQFKCEMENIFGKSTVLIYINNLNVNQM